MSRHSVQNRLSFVEHEWEADCWVELEYRIVPGNPEYRYAIRDIAELNLTIYAMRFFDCDRQIVRTLSDLSREEVARWTEGLTARLECDTDRLETLCC
jgi:hypothetical protein